MSPIFVRPVREQLEHDRLIRFLQAKYKRKFEAGINVGDDQTAPVKVGPATLFPDVVLMAGRKLAGLVEVESSESVNNLEAMAQWVPFSKVRVPFHLYVPVQAYDAARRFCDANRVNVAEVWTYRPAIEGFDLIRAFQSPSAAARASRPEPKPKPAPAPPKAKPAAKPVKPAKPAKPVKPARKEPAKKTAKPVKKAAKPAKAKAGKR